MSQTINMYSIIQLPFAIFYVYLNNKETSFSVSFEIVVDMSWQNSM